jgi:hypothetical protein
MLSCALGMLLKIQKLHIQKMWLPPQPPQLPLLLLPQPTLLLLLLLQAAVA